MLKHAIEISPATADDVARIGGGRSFTSAWKAKVIRRGDMVAAIGGAFDAGEGVWFGFIDVPAHLRDRSLFRHAVAFINELRDHGVAAVKATCDTRIPRAEEFMRRLGFEPTGETQKSEVIWCLVLKS